MIENSRAARPHYGLVFKYVEGLRAGDMTRSAVESALLAMRPDPTLPTSWADLPDCLAVALNRARSGAIELSEATALVLRILAAG